VNSPLLTLVRKGSKKDSSRNNGLKEICSKNTPRNTNSLLSIWQPKSTWKFYWLIVIKITPKDGSLNNSIWNLYNIFLYIYIYFTKFQYLAKEFSSSSNTSALFTFTFEPLWAWKLEKPVTLKGINARHEI